MVVTNGSRLINESYFESIKEHLDWLVLSIDSVDENSNLESGRFVKPGFAKKHPRTTEKERVRKGK